MAKKQTRRSLGPEGASGERTWDFVTTIPNVIGPSGERLPIGSELSLTKRRALEMQDHDARVTLKDPEQQADFDAEEVHEASDGSDDEPAEGDPANPGTL